MSRPLRLGFQLFEYFPYGGLQRDCLKTARACSGRGHAVTIYAREWEGPRPDGIEVRVFGQRGWSNVRRNEIWVRTLSQVPAQDGLHGVVGFNKLPGLDLYFGSDPCYVAKMRRLRPSWYRFTPRYRHFSRREEEVFGRGRATQLLLITPHEIPVYREIYGTEPERFHVLPPGIERRDHDPAAAAQARCRVRAREGWGATVPLLLFVGSGFRVKGLERAIAALAALPADPGPPAHLVVIGKNQPKPFANLARRMGVADRVHFLGGRDDVVEWMLAADVLVHPAHSEAGGMVLLEAMSCGLPVLATDACGYAPHIQRAGAGRILSAPYDQETCNRALAGLLQDPERRKAGENGLAYAAREDLYSCHDRAAELIEAWVGAKPAS